MSKMLVLTLLWAHGAVAARPSADRLLDRLSTEHPPWLRDLLPHPATERALKDLGIKATEKQEREVDRRIRRAGIGPESNVSREEYMKLVKLYMPLDVTASAVAFCSDLVKGMTEGKKEYKTFFSQLWNWRKIKRRMYHQLSGLLGTHGTGTASPQELTALAAEDIDREAVKFKALCPKILTGSLDRGRSVPKWALEAASWSQPGGEHHKLGRLDKVKAVKGAPWKVSFRRVCKDECEALVQRIQEKAEALYQDFTQESKPKTVEQSCAESEILGCCSRSCALRCSSIVPLKS